MNQFVEAAFSWLRLCPYVDGKLAAWEDAGCGHVIQRLALRHLSVG